MKTFDDFISKVSRSVTLKVIMLGFLILLLLIPTHRIQRLIRERQMTRDEVVMEVSDKWGHGQTISGPVLTIPYREYERQKDELKEIRKALYILPEELNIDGRINPEIRYRSIYKVIVYGSNLQIKGNFDLSDIDELNIPPENLDWDLAYLSVGITDMAGIQYEVKIKWNITDFEVNPGMKNSVFGNSGFTVNVPLLSEQTHFSFELALELNGTDWLWFVPLGKVTKVSLSSNWNTPSFNGKILPDSRDVSDSGFNATWKVTHLNRNYPQLWKDQTYNTSDTAFGVSLIFPVNEYQASMRSAKYAVLFISLTFLIYIFIEILNKWKIHPIQYLLVSFGILIFYTLLISLAEHIGFNMAYLISSISIVGLITAYSHSVFRKLKLTMIMMFSMIALYVFLFITLQMEAYALLMGSIGLFLILGIVMYLTRRVSWYSTEER